MTNALVNRIKQRLEAQRDFMRVVFSNHHALVWHLTDAPSLRLLLSETCERGERACAERDEQFPPR